MTDNELRSHFKLKPCPNSPHVFQLWRVLGEFIWAEEYWSQLVGQRMQTFYFSFHAIDSVEGTRAYSIVIWKLKIIWGIT